MRWNLLAWLLLSLWSVNAVASGFAGNELWGGRSVKQSKKERDFTIGLDAKFSPMDIAKFGVQDAAKNAMVDQCIKTEAVADCQDAVDQAFVHIADIPDSEWAVIENMAANPAQLEQKLIEAGVPQDSARAVRNYAENPNNDITPADALDLAKQVSRQNGVTILLEPYANLNFDLVEFQVGTPMIINAYKSSSDFTLGNINSDLKFGHLWDAGIVTTGLSYGVHLYFPTAYQDRANAAAYGDLFQTPKYLYGYLSLAPYIVAGVDLPFITIQAYAELVSSHRVWGDGIQKHVQYFKYGTGITILPDFVFSIIAELDGMAPLNNASAFNTLFVVGGLRLNIAWFSFSAAVQTPVYGWNRNYSDNLGISDFNQISRIGVIGRFAFIF